MDNMVRHAKHAEIMNAFEAALGVGNIKDNAATVSAYFGDWLPPKTLGMSVPPEFVVLPNGTLETQAVVKVCNRFKIPVDVSETPSDDERSATETPIGIPKSQKSRARGIHRTDDRKARTGRLLSYAEASSTSHGDTFDEDGRSESERLEVSRAAVAFVLELERYDRRSVEEMTHNNEGFDIRRLGPNGSEEFIEVKGQSGAWTEAGVALTPSEIRYAERYRDRYWLYVVEFARDPVHRQLCKLQNPFGSTTQFRFEIG